MIAPLRMALQALAANKLRSALTMLGNIIGVTCVVALINIGNSGRERMVGNLSSIGQNLIFVFPRYDREETNPSKRFHPIKISDAEAILKGCATVAEVSPSIQNACKAIFGKQSKTVQINGVWPSYVSLSDLKVFSGTNFTYTDVQRSAKVCLIGKKIADELFGNLDALGQTIRLDREPFEVVGVLEDKGASMMGADQDNNILIPVTAAQQRMSGGDSIQAIKISARIREEIPKMKEEVRAMMRHTHKLPPDRHDDVEIFDLGSMAKAFDGFLITVTGLMAAIAGISLLVGGVGIMNIMLVSVTERTREIGLRMAVGALELDILLQFLVEAVVLSSLGGLVGVLLGVGISQTVTWYLKWPQMISSTSIMLALLFSAGVGIFFGLYPAWRASRLDPIVALRHE